MVFMSENEVTIARAVPAQIEALRQHQERRARMGGAPRLVVTPRPPACFVINPGEFAAAHRLADSLLGLGGGTAESRIADIKDIVCGHYGFTFEEIESKVRIERRVRATTVAMYLIRRMLKLNFARISSHFAGRNHSCASRAMQEVEAWMAADPAFAAEMDMLVARIEGDPR